MAGASGAGGHASPDTFGNLSVRSAGMGLPAGLPDSGAGKDSGSGQTSTGPVPASSAAPLVPTTANEFAPVADSSQIVKTGQLTLQVSNLDSAVAQAQTKIAAIGGYVASSNRSGAGDDASASVTYRLPVAHWDDALADLGKLAGKVISEETNASDVTSQVIDLDARLNNLKATESAFQAIMARASAIPDVLAVEQQLSATQGQIEQLTAQRNHLGDQAAMSTVAVTFVLPTATVTTQTAQDWQLGGQIDQAVGAAGADRPGPRHHRRLGRHRRAARTAGIARPVPRLAFGATSLPPRPTSRRHPDRSGSGRRIAFDGPLAGLLPRTCRGRVNRSWPPRA